MKKTLKEILMSILGLTGLFLVFAVTDKFLLLLATKAGAILLFVVASKLMEGRA